MIFIISNYNEFDDSKLESEFDINLNHRNIEIDNKFNLKLENSSAASNIIFSGPFAAFVSNFSNMSTLSSTPIPQILAEDEIDWADYWVVRLLINLIGYGTVILPGYLFIIYAKRSGYIDRLGTGLWGQTVRACVVGTPNLQHTTAASSAETGRISEKSVTTEKRLSTSTVLSLVFCATGLLTSYLVWGLLQERVMAYEYKQTNDPSEPGEKFKNSQFIVFANRVLALVVAVAVLFATRCRTQGEEARIAGMTHRAPLYKYGYCSVSNILSSWCQYEALKYVSFAVQVLAKASKVIPVMLMGKIVSRRTYSYFEYFTAVLISVGLFLFLLYSSDEVAVKGSKSLRTTTVSGIVILVGYLAFDSFTSNWQGELFKTYRMTSIEMMAGVNLFSVLLTSVSLIEQGSFFEAAAFMRRHPSFIIHVSVLSLTSAVGQLFIFHTIKLHGPVTFTIIMTIRQAAAILLSTLVYGHSISLVAGVGVVIVFVAVFLRSCPPTKAKKISGRQGDESSKKVKESRSEVPAEVKFVKEIHR